MKPKNDVQSLHFLMIALPKTPLMPWKNLALTPIASGLQFGAAMPSLAE